MHRGKEKRGRSGLKKRVRKKGKECEKQEGERRGMKMREKNCEMREDQAREGGNTGEEIRGTEEEGKGKKKKELMR